MDDLALRDYLCSQANTGPWQAVFASNYEQAATQFARVEDLRPGDTVFVGLPSPVPHVFSGESLAKFIADRLGIHSCRELEEMAVGLAGEANYRLEKFATDKAAILGRAMKVRSIEITEDMSVPQFSLA